MKRRAFSLIEILLVSALLLLLLDLCLQVLMPLMQTYLRSDRRTALMQGVAGAMDKVVSELQESNIRGFNFVTAPAPGVEAALLIQPLGLPRSNGDALWSPQLNCFVRQGGLLSYRQWRGPALISHTSTTPYPPAPAELPDILVGPDSTLLLTGVTTFQINGLESGNRTLPLKVDIAVTLPSGESLEITHQVSPRSRASR